MRVGGLLGVLVLVGCGGPIPLEKYCEEVTRANCFWEQEWGLRTRSFDCASMAPDPHCNDFYSQGLAAGTITYDPAASGKCMQEIRAAEFSHPTPCLAVFGGGKAGESCGVCDAELVCVGFSDGACGSCQARPAPPTMPKAALGEPCGSPNLGGAGCSDNNAVCLQSSEDGIFRCVALVPRGVPCDFAAPCERGFFCRSEGAQPVCGPLMELGERCNQVECKLGLRCSEGVCTAQLRDGQSCVDGRDCASHVCQAGVCARAADEGEPCENQCRRDLRCIRSICVSPKSAGEACVDAAECAGAGSCVNGVCHDGFLDCH